MPGLELPMRFSARMEKSSLASRLVVLVKIVVHRPNVKLEITKRDRFPQDRTQDVAPFRLLCSG